MKTNNDSKKTLDYIIKKLLISVSVVRDPKTKQRIKYPEQIESDASFREAFDLTSLDIADLIVSLEETYKVKIADEPTKIIDSINDVKNLFKKSLIAARQKFISNKQKQKIINILKPIILDRAEEKGVNNQYGETDPEKALTKFDYLDIFEITMKFESGYNAKADKKIFIEEEIVSVLSAAKSLDEFCEILLCCTEGKPFVSAQKQTEQQQTRYKEITQKVKNFFIQKFSNTKVK